MTKITVKEDCGNAPKKEFIRDFNLAFAENKKEKILEFMDEEITWNMIGGKVMHGHKEAMEFLQSMGEDVAEELVVETIVTHGDSAAANGEIRYKEMTVAFCDVYQFSGHDKNAKIKTLTSYGIELKSSQ